jgi:ribonuclease E
MKKEMLINVLQPEEIRIAIIENGVLEELYVERTSHESYVGNIYKGRIVNIEPSIQAAFVDFGVGRNGFLHVSDVEPAYYKDMEAPSYGRRDDRERDRDRGDRRNGPRGGRGGRDDRPPPRRGGRDEPVRRSPPVVEEEREEAVFETPVQEPAAFVEPPLAPFSEPVFEPAEPIQDRYEPLWTDDAAPAPVSEPPAPSGFGAGIFDDNAPATAPRADRGAPVTSERAEPAARAPAPPIAEESAAQPAANAAEGDLDAAEEKELPVKGRRRPARAKTTRKPRGEKAKKDAAKDQAAPDQEPPSPDERPRLMESSERRTDEHDPTTMPRDPRPAPDISDAELSFSMPRREERPSPPVEQPPVWEPPPEPAPRPDPAPYTPARAEQPRFPLEPELDDEPIWEKPAPPRRDEALDDDDAADAPAGNAPVIDFDEDYGADFNEDQESEESDESADADAPHDRRPPGAPAGRGRDDRRGGPQRGRRPMGRPGTGRPKPPIQEIFKRGQEVLVQVIKEGIGTKGPTLSTYISIAGRYLVLMPGLARVGVSRKIEDDETRRRLREIMNELRPPKGLGFIIRTAGQDRNKKELQGDLAYLSRLWQVVAQRIRATKSPAEIYQESDMVTRTIRDIFTGDIDAIWVDEKNAYEAAKEFLTIVMPRFADRIKFWDSKEPMFHKHGIEQEIARIQQRHVPLPHGGSIVIDQTEALVAIDVNSGNFRADNNAEETAYQMNLQAAKEIARQLRLRDLGGVIANDFIDMRDERHRRNVEKALRDAVQRDRARTKILRISQFGIIEMTRQRIRPSLKRSVYQDCLHCRGTGQVKTVESMSIEVMRLLQLAVHRALVTRVEVQVHDTVAQYLLNRKRKDIVQLEEQTAKAVSVRSAGTSVAPEHLEFLCYDNNNNEVKFIPFEEPRPPARRRMR